MVTRFGVKLTTHAHPAYELMRTGNFEPDETPIFHKLRDLTDIFADVGANVGYCCCFALQRKKAVVAFEPQAHNLICLFRNITANEGHDNIEVFALALSSQVGLLTLFGASGPSASLVKIWAGYSPLFKQTVAANTLDNIPVGRFPQARPLIKIDADIFDLFRHHGYSCYAAEKRRTAVAPAAIQRWLDTGVHEVPTFNYVFIDSSVNLQTVVGSAECIQ